MKFLTYLMKRKCDLVLSTPSGKGCVQELYEYMVSEKMINECTLNSVIERDSKESVKY